jgi:hypothetical protein
MKHFHWILFAVFIAGCGVNAPNHSSRDVPDYSGWYASETIFSGNSLPNQEDRDSLFVHGLFLKVDSDSIHLLGSGSHYHFPRFNGSDTLGLLKLDDRTGMAIWRRGKVNINWNNGQTTSYAFRPDLRYWASGLHQPVEVEKHEERYIVNDLIAGTYIQANTSNEVVFTKSGLVKGLPGYREYRVVSDFSHLYLYKGKSLLFLTNLRQRELPFEWEVDEQQLTLKKYVPETVYLDGVKWSGDYLVPNGTEYRFELAQSN